MTREQFLKGAVAAATSLAAQADDRRTPAGGLYDIYPVPPLARKNDSNRSLNQVENDRMIRFLLAGGCSRIVYGGNALVYHLTLSEYRDLIEWLSGWTDKVGLIPAIGPSYGRALDHAAIVRGHRFASLLMLPTGDPRDAAGLETGLRRIADASGIPLSIYVKEEGNFGADKEAGLDVIGRLVDDGVCVSVKYAVVRKNPSEDGYLRGLLTRVDPSRVISGIGERPAIVHLREFKMGGFTTGSGVLAPKLCRRLLDSCSRHDWENAEQVRQAFLPLEDLRDAWGAPRVLHYAVAAAGIADTGPISPFLSPLNAGQFDQLKGVAAALRARG